MTQPGGAPGAGGTVGTATAPVLSAVGLVKGFGATPALRGADLEVRAGEIVAVLGPSGSGKSTLLHCVAGILRPDAGAVHHRGRDLATMGDRELSVVRRTEFGFVFQFGQLIPELTCLQNIALPLRLGGASSRVAAAAAREWLGRLGIADVADQHPGQVSGGQAQRVAVARALIGCPAVIFADEPTGALDTLQGEKVMELLAGAVEEVDAALVLVTHEPRVAAWSDREIVVRDGRTTETRR
ncbi:ABC transporter ATP-binding protein [Nakamurella deserti]|uniref:ABC transporter ATP-binding protein n=1 Tax=Nakamurella deserti TaxID=2164074 RepID=UPI000DBE693C|nr:ABC transporter ATP-binding protein [Nakamurella deserti]